MASATNNMYKQCETCKNKLQSFCTSTQCANCCNHAMENFPFDFHEMNSNVFIPFEINASIDTPLTEMDPEIQYYLNSNYTHGAKCDYYLEDQFISKVVEKNCNRLSFFHLNVKSIPKHFDLHGDFQ